MILELATWVAKSGSFNLDLKAVNVKNGGSCKSICLISEIFSISLLELFAA